MTANEDAALEQYVQYVQVPHLLPGGLYGLSSQLSMEKPSRHVLSTKWRSSPAAGPPATRGTCTGHSAVCSVQCAVCSVQCAVCRVQCAVCSVWCAALSSTCTAVQCAQRPDLYVSGLLVLAVK